MIHQLEIIGFNIESCIIAQEAGADRIELCSGPGEGGTTPSIGFIKAARKHLAIELFPIIRPRGGDFLYNEAEFEIMKTDINSCKQIGCDGIVIGMLNSDGSIDKNRCRQLVDLAYPLSVTFHRAFDRTRDPFEALEDIIETGCERILTSGQKPEAADASAVITSLIARADKRITIMPGSGIRSDNIATIATGTGAVEFHSSARMMVRGNMQFTQPMLNETLTFASVDAAEVKHMKRILSEL